MLGVGVMSGEYQKEFFNEFQREKGKIETIARRITKRQKKLYLNIPLENIVFTAIIVLLFVIVSFALGVERGRKLNIKQTASIETESVLPEKKFLSEKKELPAEEKPVVNKVLDKRYTVQLVSFRKEKVAEEEKAKLLKKGIDAFVVRSGSWYQLCAGGYPNMKEAEKAKEQFVKDYKGCFIKKVI